jgi:hypothetical protein
MLEIKKPWEFDDAQIITIKDKKYNPHAAIFAARDLPIKNLLLADFNIAYGSPCSDNLRDFIAHCKLVNEADLSYPIILNEDGAVIDGKHRLCKAILDGRETIATKRFESDPQSIWQWA